MSDTLDGAHQIDEAVPLEVALAAQRGRALQENALNLLRPLNELPSNGKKRRDRARDVWCGHAGTTVIHIGGHVVVDRYSQLLTLRFRGARSDPLARSHQVGLEPSVAGRPLGGEKG